MAPLRIEISGVSTIFLPAERAVVSISVQHEGENQEKVSKEVISTSAKLRDILSSISGKDDKGQPLESAAITHWSNTSLATGSYFQYIGSKKKNRIHQASMTFEAKFRDFAKLGAVATTLSTMEHVSIASISWRLTDKTKQSVTTRCRVQAVQDAMAKARDYAAALDRKVPPVIQICDTQVGSSYNTAGQVMVRTAYSSTAQTRDELNFTPEDVSLDCSVEVVCEEQA